MHARTYTDDELRSALARLTKIAGDNPTPSQQRALSVLRLRLLGRSAGEIAGIVGIRWENTVHGVLWAAVRADRRACGCEVRA